MNFSVSALRIVAAKLSLLADSRACSPPHVSDGAVSECGGKWVGECVVGGLVSKHVGSRLLHERSRCTSFERQWIGGVGGVRVGEGGRRWVGEGEVGGGGVVDGLGFRISSFKERRITEEQGRDLGQKQKQGIWDRGLIGKAQQQQRSR